ncbi:MAG TPA: hypothetical protein VFE46_16570 [Pirellulales bacterium]|jgi:hypothetical protein|nr:hypothetical protein [Pirellulales bacterium]
MNARVRYFEKRDRFIHSLDGKEFGFDPTNKSSRKAALARLNEHGTKVISTLESNAGRPLSDHELSRGVEHFDDRTRNERVAEFTAQAMRQAKNEVARENPYQKALDSGFVDPERRETRRDMYERCAREWDTKADAEAERLELESDPKRQRAVSHAKRELLEMRFDPHFTFSEIKAAEARLELARSGDLAHYAVLDREWRDAKQAKIDARVAAVTSRLKLCVNAKRKSRPTPSSSCRPQQSRAPSIEVIDIRPRAFQGGARLFRGPCAGFGRRRDFSGGFTWTYRLRITN